MTFALISSAFAHGAAIPSIHTCESADVPPPLMWSGAPSATKTFALIVDDPDAPDPAAPKMTYVHWVVYDIPATTQALRGADAQTLPAKAKHGVNDWHRTGYGGPCPPIGRHRYFFKLYALDVEFGDIGTPTKQELEAAMAGHILAQAELMGTYQKGQG